MFRGSSFHTIDPKGRIIIPARFRDVIKAGGADGIMVTGWDSCLFAYPHDKWGELEQKVLHSPEKSEAMRRFQRLFIGGAHDCKCDAQGRVLIPPMLKQYAKLEKDIVLVGVLYRFEIMSRDIWDKENGLMEKDLGEDQVRHEIARLGL
jgi:MraZ protein